MKKMYTSFRLILALGLVVSLASCGEKAPKEIKIKPVSTQIKGDLGSCYTVVDKEYDLKQESSSSRIITVEIERTSGNLPFDVSVTDPFGVSSDGKYCHAGFGIAILDEDGEPIFIKNATEGGMGGPYSHEDVKGLINLESGSTAYIRWSVDLDKEVLAKAKSFMIVSAMECREPSPSAAVSEPEEETITTSSSTNWDKVLDSYESFTNKYIDLAKKVKAGNNNVMNEYMKCMKEAEKFQSNLAESQSELSAAQVARMNKIAMKMANAASQL